MYRDPTILYQRRLLNLLPPLPPHTYLLPAGRGDPQFISSQILGPNMVSSSTSSQVNLQTFLHPLKCGGKVITFVAKPGEYAGNRFYKCHLDSHLIKILPYAGGSSAYSLSCSLCMPNDSTTTASNQRTNPYCSRPLLLSFFGHPPLQRRFTWEGWLQVGRQAQSWIPRRFLCFSHLRRH